MRLVRLHGVIGYKSENLRTIVHHEVIWMSDWKDGVVLFELDASLEALNLTCAQFELQLKLFDGRSEPFIIFNMSLKLFFDEAKLRY